MDKITDKEIQTLLNEFKQKKALFQKKEIFPLSIAFIGGSGVGKSSLLNLIAGNNISKSSAIRPTTNFPIAFYPDDLNFNPKQWGFDITFKYEKYSPNKFNNEMKIIFFDLPDIDSIKTDHKYIAESALKNCDIIFFIVSPDKYGDMILYDFYKKAIKEKKNIFIVINKIDIVTKKEISIIENTLFDNEHFGEKNIKNIEFIKISSKKPNIYRDTLIKKLKYFSEQKNKIRTAEMLKLKKDTKIVLENFKNSINEKIKNITNLKNRIFKLSQNTSFEINGLILNAYESVKVDYFAILENLYSFSPLSPINFINALFKYTVNIFYLIINKFISMIGKFVSVLFSIFKYFFKSSVKPKKNISIKKDSFELNSYILKLKNAISDNFKTNSYIEKIYNYIDNVNSTETEIKLSFKRNLIKNNLELNISYYFDTLYINLLKIKKRFKKFDFFAVIFDWLLILFSLVFYNHGITYLKNILPMDYFYNYRLIIYIIFIFIISNFIKKIYINMIFESNFEKESETFTICILNEFQNLKKNSVEKMEDELNSLKEQINIIKKEIKNL